jgi:hypothetical protein
MDVNWKQTTKGTWSAAGHDQKSEWRSVWTATIRQRKNAKETVYSWTVGGPRKGTFSGIAPGLAAAKEAAMAAVHAHIEPEAEAEPDGEVAGEAAASTE